MPPRGSCGYLLSCWVEGAGGEWVAWTVSNGREGTERVKREQGWQRTERQWAAGVTEGRLVWDETWHGTGQGGTWREGNSKEKGRKRTGFRHRVTHSALENAAFPYHCTLPPSIFVIPGYLLLIECSLWGWGKRKKMVHRPIKFYIFQLVFSTIMKALSNLVYWVLLPIKWCTSLVHLNDDHSPTTQRTWASVSHLSQEGRQSRRGGCVRGDVTSTQHITNYTWQGV